MPLAVTHVILTIVLVDLYRDYILKNKKYFTMHTVMIAGIAGLLPDIDIPLSKIFALFSIHIEWIEHGMITHTPIFGLIFLIPAFYFLKKENKTMASYFFVITFGVLFHIFLDFLLGGGRYEGIMLFWPILDQPYKIHLLRHFGEHIFISLDAIILLLWLYHEEVKHKIKDFI
ncbi:MAG: metal-dependent hydrolase [Candidatus Aenigmarchaeota archaeon]|nr:metal-dependent hydrolase [Candidatus Aenigmarchaeota archaeon]